MINKKQFFKNKIKSFLQWLCLYKNTNVWSKISDNKKQFFIDNVNIKTSLETINNIKETISKQKKGAYMRFGDGDIFLMLGKDEMLQKANKKMSIEMKEAIQLSVGTLHKGYPLHSNLFGFEKGMIQNMHLVSDSDALNFLSVTHKFIDFENIYSPVALHYLSTFNKEVCLNFLQFLKNINPIFVGNHNVKSEIVKKLFGNIHIQTPSKNSYLEIDRIEDELIQELDREKNEFKVIVLAMGCPGRILQKRILQKGYNVYLFDFGSLLDAFNNESSRLWIDLAGIDKLKNILQSIDS